MNSYINIYKSKYGKEMYETQDTVNMNYVYDQVMMDRELKAGGGQLR